MSEDSRKAAFSIGKAESGLAQCLQINLYQPRQGLGLDRFDLSFDLNCGVHPLGDGLSIVARQARVFMVLEGCGFERGSPYSYALQQGKIETSQSTEATRERSAGSSANGSFEGGFKNWLGVLNFSAGAKAQAETQSRNKTNEGAKVTPAIPLISFEAGNTWVVGGDLHGDCRQVGGFLRGTYFNEDRDDEGSPKPACWLRAEEKGDGVKAAVGIAVRPGDLWVIADGKLDKAERAGDRGDGTEERLAGMAILKRLRKEERKEMAAAVPNEHVVIACATLAGRMEDGDAGS